MSDKKQKKIYEALVEGATEGKTDVELYNYVVEKCPNATGKKIVRASLLALSDPTLRDANILQVIYALAIKHRTARSVENDMDDGN